MIDCLPRRGDYFPKTRRGHGTTHPRDRRDVDGFALERNANPCIDQTCILHMPKSKNFHEDQGANVRDWCEERGLSLRTKANPNGRFSSPGVAMLLTTGVKLVVTRL